MIRIYSALLIVSVLMVSCKEAEKKKEGPAAGGEPKPVQVDGIIARETGTSSQISTTGTILANEEVEVKSEVTGKKVLWLPKDNYWCNCRMMTSRRSSKN